MSRRWWTIFLLGLTLVASKGQAADEEPRLIVVTAVSEKGVDPDMISMNVEVWSKSATAQRAQQLGANEMKQALASFEQFKIRKEDQQTVSYFFGPEYVYDPRTSQQKLAGFRSTQTVRIILRKTDQAGKLIDALSASSKGGGSPKSESGLNLNAIEWDSSKRSELETEILGDAVKNARRKADELAKAGGVKIKNVHRLTHYSSDEAPPVFREGRGAMMKAEMADSPTALSAGQIKVRVQVAAEFEIVD